MNAAQASYMHVLYPLQGKVLNLFFKTQERIYMLDIVTLCILLLTIKWPDISKKGIVEIRITLLCKNLPSIPN